MSSVRFYPRIPSYRDAPLIFQPPRPARAAPMACVLVVDGDATAGARLAHWFYRTGYAVAVSGSADQADRFLATHAFDLVVADIEQLQAGRTWLERLCARSNPLAILLTPSRLDLSSATQAALLPLAGYLPKPIDLPALTAVLSRLFRDRADGHVEESPKLSTV